MNTIIDNIMGGQHDEFLNDIIEAVQQRRKLIARRAASSLKTGDTVRFSDTIRPKYLVGKTATVVKVNRESVVVTCPTDPSYGRFNGSRNVRCPNSLIAGLA